MTGECSWHKFTKKQRFVFDCYKVYAQAALESGSLSEERVIYGDMDALGQMVSFHGVLFEVF